MELTTFRASHGHTIVPLRAFIVAAKTRNWTGPIWLDRHVVLRGAIIDDLTTGLISEMVKMDDLIGVTALVTNWEALCAAVVRERTGRKRSRILIEE